MRRYFFGHTANRFATSYSIGEALGALKRKYLRNRISQADYINYVNAFIGLVISSIKRDEVSIFAPVLAREGERLIATYDIDFLDAFQIVTLLHGTFRYSGPNSKSLLVTADRDLAKAARAEGAKAWVVTTEPAPPE